MATTILSSHQFGEDVSLAQRATNQGPVIITEGGQPAYVLLRHEQYISLAGAKSPDHRRDKVDPEFDPIQTADGISRPI